MQTVERIIEKISPNLSVPAEKNALKRSNDLLRAKWLFAKGDYTGAIRLLRQTQSVEAGTGAEEAQAVVALRLRGDACAAIQQWREAAEAYEQAARLQPKTIGLRLAAAAAWARTNRWVWRRPSSSNSLACRASVAVGSRSRNRWPGRETPNRNFRKDGGSR